MADSNSNLVKSVLEEDLQEQKKIGTGYFEAACTLSILMFIAMAGVLFLTLSDLDKCETKPSAHCPYFTNPQSYQKAPTDPNTDTDITSAFRTEVRIPGSGNTIPLDPFVYK
tara:strand:- start:335 stop:670 length:336 start_codon:yes stop_codon:yes gene_type:complete